MKDDKKYTNRLINETSPYLLQHAHNPVDWFPWGEDAFIEAKRQDKPIFLSVGYSACHWCHVMEQESFEDEDTAKLMNELFINIKVDREERPDVDTIYMNVVQMMSGGHGGWPMSVFITPEKKPYYAGTYFPKQRRYNMPAFKDVLVSVSNYYKDKKEVVDKNAEILISNLKKLNAYNYSDEDINYEIIDKALEHLEDYFDYDNGGFGSQPKFPNTFNLDLLLRAYLVKNEKKYLDMVTLSLKKMSNGGLYDHLGGGFFRYSVDYHWLIPHFEKMLYDNSVLIKLLLEVFQIAKDDFFKNKALESLEYIIREMYQEEGCFYSTQDADSEGKEGKFYTWKQKEVLDLLGEKEGTLFCKFFDISENGNFEEEKNNLQVLFTTQEFSEKLKVHHGELMEILEKGKQTLFENRKERIAPNTDTKIITAWNAIMLSAFIKTYEITFDRKYLEIVEKSINFIFSKLFKENFLLRTYKDNQSKFNAYLEDYAFLIDALIDLYQVTFKEEWLEKANHLNNILLEYFWDNEKDGFFFTGINHEELLVRTKEITDHSIPSGNAIAVKNLMRLARITENEDLNKRAEKLFKTFYAHIKKFPSSSSSLLCNLDFYLNPPIDIVLVDNSEFEITKFSKVFKDFNPYRVIHFKNISKTNNLAIFKDKNMLSNRPTIYSCKNFTCGKPIVL